MLRNHKQNKQLLTKLLPIIQQQRLIQQPTAILYNKTDINRQGKIMKKLFDHRVSGSKKRWIPTGDSSLPVSSNMLLKGSHFGKSKAGGKNLTRRMTVINKLLMEHITDLMATGEISERILGKGLQILRVKISQDFSSVNVYYTLNSETCNYDFLEQELKLCSGILRHELSQLCLLGVVPRIQFVKDKFLTNIGQIESMLANLDLSTEKETQEDSYNPNKEYVESLKQVFFGRKDVSTTVPESVEENDESPSILKSDVPEMRHDVLGLDHKGIMIKILTKMRKSKQAWDRHFQNSSSNNTDSTTIPSASFMQLAKVNEKLAIAYKNSEKFDAFLAQRKERRNTAERKKFSSANYSNIDVLNPDIEDDYPEITLSKSQRQLYEAEDYLVDEMEDKKL